MFIDYAKIELQAGYGGIGIVSFHREKYIDKGRMLFIQGQIETREYDDNGTTKYITEIVIPTFGGAMRIIDSKGGSGGSNKSTQGTKETQSNKEEDIPF